MMKEDERPFFWMRRSLKKQVLVSSEKTRSDFILATFLYDADEEIPEITPEADALLDIVKADIDMNAQRYKETCDRNRARRQAGIEKKNLKDKILDIAEEYYITELADNINPDYEIEEEDLERQLQNLDSMSQTELERLLNILVEARADIEYQR